MDDADGSALALLGFDAGSERLLLRPKSSPDTAGQDGPVVRVEASELPSACLKRDLNDLRRWDRALRRRRDGGALARLPAKKLRKLMERSWVKGDAGSGWRLELQKNVAACEAWINAALAALTDEERREFLDDKLYARARERRSAERAGVQRAKDLQQYFTSQPLVELLVAAVKAQVVGEMGLAMADAVFLEPSFGDGRIVSALVEAGARNVIGYEIDPSLVPQAATGAKHGPNDGPNDRPNVCLRSGDFLTSKVADAPVVTRDKMVVAVGNPPFGDKQADQVPGSAPPADLVLRFMTHAAVEWRACIVVFIVPERCANPSFVRAALEALSSGSGVGQWQLGSSEPLDGHTFELGVKRVKQPSVLQIFTLTTTH